jgi:hypothetical protein
MMRDRGNAFVTTNTCNCPIHEVGSIEIYQIVEEGVEEM